MTRKKGAFLALALTLAVAGTFACGGGPSGGRATEKEQSVSGVIVEVKAASLLELDTLTLEDSTGRRWSFQGRSYRRLTPSHLREHMLQGLPVTVVFRRDGDTLYIDDITDQ